MVQKEVRKKTSAYGLIGILLAILLVATIYSYGVTPGTSPGLPSPEVSSTPKASPIPSSAPPEISPMNTFASYSELENFLNSSSSNNGYNSLDSNRFTVTGQGVPEPAPSSAPVAAAAPTTESTTTKDYSTTNIQVAGVDEADTVKTDGKYLYVIGNNSQVVYILDANPQNAKVLAKIWLNNSFLSGIYLSADGNKLAVLGNQYISNGYAYPMPRNSIAAIYPYYQSSANFVYVYNISNKANPVLARNFTISGNYVNSRMIGNYIYDIVTENAFVVNGTANLPTVFADKGACNVVATRIYYANTTGSYYSYTTIVGLDVMNDAAPATNMTIMMGNAGTIYVSQSNIYVTYPVTNYETITQPTATAFPSSSDKNGTIAIMPMPVMMIRPTWQGTSIYRISVSGPYLTFAAKGNVTGTILSQYSMDESNGFFRVATTSYDYNSDSWSGTQQNNLYVLNSDLKVIGKIENLASGETLHAARFMGTRCYLVTFQQVDPLFVVDLTQPTAPKVLGNLTIPGYSDFLQPYDATHLIGIGQDVNASIDADKVHEAGAVYYTAILGLKVSLFDVSDVANPKEISKYVIGDRGTTSEALSDPKALLFDASRNILVLPVDLYLAVNYTKTTPTATPVVTGKSDGTSIAPIMPPIDSSFDAYPQFAWQGVYIFNISINGGLVLKGNVTQMDNATALLANPSLAMMSSYQWINNNQFISRSLYIGNVLYTFSQNRVQLNSLNDFTLIAKIDLK